MSNLWDRTPEEIAEIVDVLGAIGFDDPAQKNTIPQSLWNKFASDSLHYVPEKIIQNLGGAMPAPGQCTFKQFFCELRRRGYAPKPEDEDKNI